MKWDEFVYNSDKAVICIKRLIENRFFSVSIHKIQEIDDVGCYHTHRAMSFRLILAGGYIDEREDGEFFLWKPGNCGLVSPGMSHRIACLLDGPSYSLWIRGPITHKIELRGPGWKKWFDKQNKTE